MKRGANMESNYYIKIIKDFRKQKGFTQEKLAELLDYDPTYISRIETEKREPSIEFFIRFSDFSQIPIDYLLCSEAKIGTQIKFDEISQRAFKLSSKDRQFLFDIIDNLLSRFEYDNK